MEPKNLDEAVEIIMVQLTPANIMDLQDVNEEYSMTCLNGLKIRNDWNLWYKSDLSLWFAEHGIYHADDMSGVIEKTVWERVCGKRITPIEEHQKYFQAHWDKYECDVKTQFEERCNE